MIAEPTGSDRYGGAMADVLHDASHPRATRVERSFAFVDLSGFTRFTDVQGDDEAVDILSAFRAVVRGVASTHGVRIAKWLGDGAMLVGVEPEPLLEALVEIEGLITDSGCHCRCVRLYDRARDLDRRRRLCRPCRQPRRRLCAAAEPRQVLAIADDIVHLYTDIVSVPAGRRDSRCRGPRRRRRDPTLTWTPTARPGPISNERRVPYSTPCNLETS